MSDVLMLSVAVGLKG